MSVCFRLSISCECGRALRNLFSSYSFSFRVACKISLSIFPVFFNKSVSSGRFPTTKPTFSFRFCFYHNQSVFFFTLISLTFQIPQFLLSCCLIRFAYAIECFVFFFAFINLIFILNSAIIRFLFYCISMFHHY